MMQAHVPSDAACIAMDRMVQEQSVMLATNEIMLYVVATFVISVTVIWLARRVPCVRWTCRKRGIEAPCSCVFRARRREAILVDVPRDLAALSPPTLPASPVPIIG